MTPPQIAVLMSFVFASDTQTEVSYPPAVLNHLIADQLVTADEKQLTDRGRAMVEHLLSLDLPQQVTVWRVMRANADWAQEHPAVRLPSAVTAASAEDGPPPPPAPPMKRLNGIEVPTDPAAKRALGLQLMNGGMGVGEVAELLGVTFDEADSYFRSQ